MLKSAVDDFSSWENLAASDSLFKHVSSETQKIGGSFPGIGRNNTLTGSLLAMDVGAMSSIIETFNAVLILELTAKDEMDDEKYGEAYDSIRDNMLRTELSRGYTSWLSDARKSIKKEDYRSEVY